MGNCLACLGRYDEAREKYDLARLRGDRPSVSAPLTS